MKLDPICAGIAQRGWDEERVRQELTLAISEEGANFMRTLLEDLITRARKEWKSKQTNRSLEEGGR